MVLHSGSMDQNIVIAVTRNGLGDWLLFDSFEEADEHPQVQYGDIILTRPEDFLVKWTNLELPGLLGSLDLGSLPLDREILLRNSAKIWARMVGRSERPSSDPEKICDIIRRDRKLTLTERKIMTKDATNTKPATEKAAAPQARKFPGTMKITLLADAEGTPYGPKNNPKRESTKSHTRFAIYTNGMTVDEYIAKGGVYADIPYDVTKKFIKVG